MKTTRCQISGSTDAVSIIQLGHHPLADTFLADEARQEPETRYPLEVLLFPESGYATLAYIMPPQERYQKVDYSYTASNSPVAVKHFGEMAQEICDELGLTAQDLVVDIGGNDGTLLKAFHAISQSRMLNVEPAGNIAKIAEAANVPTLTDFFGAEAVRTIGTMGKAKAITGTNVFNHITDLQAFTADIAAALTDDGAFIFEAPSLLELVKRMAFDTIYLEHVSYFGIKPLVRLFGDHGLSIHRIEPSDYMGGSMRVYVKKTKADPAVVNGFMEQEQALGIYDQQTYVGFMERVRAFKMNLNTELYEIKKRGGVIVGIGAATKGNTLLNYCGIDGTLLTCVTDASALKIGKFTPGSLLPIVADADIPKNATHALILPWNIGVFLKEKLKHLNLEFIVPRMD